MATESFNQLSIHGFGPQVKRFFACLELISLLFLNA